jgi:hypothetical protein
MMARIVPETQAEDVFRSAVWDNAESDFRKAASRIGESSLKKLCHFFSLFNLKMIN